MRHFRKIVALVFLLTLVGCSGISYALDNYGDVKPVPFKNEKDTWRIFDKPSENKLMITPSVGRSAGDGFLLGLTSEPAPVFLNAAQGYIDSTNRDCSIINISLIVDPQYEVNYRC